jgi:hypothetical protein
MARIAAWDAVVTNASKEPLAEVATLVDEPATKFRTEAKEPVREVNVPKLKPTASITLPKSYVPVNTGGPVVRNFTIVKKDKSINLSADPSKLSATLSRETSIKSCDAFKHKDGAIEKSESTKTDISADKGASERFETTKASEQITKSDAESSTVKVDSHFVKEDVDKAKIVSATSTTSTSVSAEIVETGTVSGSSAEKTAPIDSKVYLKMSATDGSETSDISKTSSLTLASESSSVPHVDHDHHSKSIFDDGSSPLSLDVRVYHDQINNVSIVEVEKEKPVEASVTKVDSHIEEKGAGKAKSVHFLSTASTSASAEVVQTSAVSESIAETTVEVVREMTPVIPIDSKVSLKISTDEETETDAKTSSLALASESSSLHHVDHDHHTKAMSKDEPSPVALDVHVHLGYTNSSSEEVEKKEVTMATVVKVDALIVEKEMDKAKSVDVTGAVSVSADIAQVSTLSVSSIEMIAPIESESFVKISTADESETSGISKTSSLTFARKSLSIVHVQSVIEESTPPPDQHTTTIHAPVKVVEATLSREVEHDPSITASKTVHDVVVIREKQDDGDITLSKESASSSHEAAEVSLNPPTTATLSLDVIAVGIGSDHHSNLVTKDEPSPLLEEVHVNHDHIIHTSAEVEKKEPVESSMTKVHAVEKDIDKAKSVSATSSSSAQAALAVSTEIVETSIVRPSVAETTVEVVNDEVRKMEIAPIDSKVSLKISTDEETETDDKTLSLALASESSSVPHVDHDHHSKMMSKDEPSPLALDVHVHHDQINNSSMVEVEKEKPVASMTKVHAGSHFVEMDKDQANSCVVASTSTSASAGIVEINTLSGSTVDMITDAVSETEVAPIQSEISVKMSTDIQSSIKESSPQPADHSTILPIAIMVVESASSREAEHDPSMMSKTVVNGHQDVEINVDVTISNESASSSHEVSLNPPTTAKLSLKNIAVDVDHDHHSKLVVKDEPSPVLEEVHVNHDHIIHTSAEVEKNESVELSMIKEYAHDMENVIDKATITTIASSTFVSAQAASAVSAEIVETSIVSASITETTVEVVREMTPVTPIDSHVSVKISTDEGSETSDISKTSSLVLASESSSVPHVDHDHHFKDESSRLVLDVHVHHGRTNSSSGEVEKKEAVEASMTEVDALIVEKDMDKKNSVNEIRQSGNSVSTSNSGSSDVPPVDVTKALKRRDSASFRFKIGDSTSSPASIPRSSDSNMDSSDVSMDRPNSPPKMLRRNSGSYRSPKADTDPDDPVLQRTKSKLGYASTTYVPPAAKVKAIKDREIQFHLIYDDVTASEAALEGSTRNLTIENSPIEDKTKIDALTSSEELSTVVHVSVDDYSDKKTSLSDAMISDEAALLLPESINEEILTNSQNGSCSEEKVEIATHEESSIPHDASRVSVVDANTTSTIQLSKDPPVSYVTDLINSAFISERAEVTSVHEEKTSDSKYGRQPSHLVYICL